MTYLNSHLLWKNTIGFLTPGGIFPHSSILEASVGVSTIDLTLTEIEKKQKQQHVLVKCVQRNLDRK